MTAAEEVKSKFDLIDLVAEYVRLTPAGGQSMRGLCPFHGEKTPSFYAHKDKQFWHCFGCGEGGDLFTFYQKIENVDFRDALKELARRVGVALPEYDPKADSERARLFAVLEDAARYYEAALKHEAGGRAKTYLSRRGITDATIAEFRLGYAPSSWDACVKALATKGHAPEKLIAAGLAIQSERGRGFYDRFRDRIMVPLRDERGQVVGFTGRILPDNPEAEKTGKYVNTPETQLYHKRRLVFALDRARPHIKEANFAVLVEGNMDAIASHQAGVKNVVAVSGTAFSEEQIDILKRSTDRIALAFDADIAGQNAMSRALPHAWKSGLRVMVVLLPSGFKDPDEVIRKDPALWRQAIADARDVVAYSIGRALEGLKPDDPFSKRQALASLKALFGLLDAEPVLYDHWIHALAERIELSDQAVREALSSSRAAMKERKGSDDAASAVHESREDRLAKRLFSLILSENEQFERMAAQVDPSFIPEGPLRTLAKMLQTYYSVSGQSPLPLDGFLSQIAERRASGEPLPPAEALIMLKERDMPDWAPDQLAIEAATCLRELKEAAERRERKELVGELAEAERRGDAAQARQIAERLTQSAQSSDR